MGIAEGIDMLGGIQWLFVSGRFQRINSTSRKPENGNTVSERHGQLEFIILDAIAFQFVKFNGVRNQSVPE
jgi:hypothetical protein